MLTLPDPSHTIIILSNSYSRSPRRKLGNKRAVAILNTNHLTRINIVFVTNTNSTRQNVGTSKIYKALDKTCSQSQKI